MAVGGDYKRDYFIYLTPFVPLSLKGEGEINKKEGLAPLLDTRKRSWISA